MAKPAGEDVIEVRGQYFDKVTRRYLGPINEGDGDLESMTKDELVAHAESVGVEVNKSAKKDEIIAAIEAGPSAEADTE